MHSKAESIGYQGHPMDDIQVRALDFDFTGKASDKVQWSQSSPEAAMFLNAFGVHVPYFERYLVRAMTLAKKYVKDDRLLADISNIIGQEAHHARNFIDFNRTLASVYPKIDKLEMKAKAHFSKHAKNDSLEKLIGYTAGYETFTFLAGMVVLAEYEEWMGESDPTMKALWVWHQVEEVEHGAVAFEVFQHMYGEREWYRKYMIIKALTEITIEVVKAYSVQCHGAGYFKSPRRLFNAYRFLFTKLTVMLVNALPAFSKNYTPKAHPLVADGENRIAFAWRRFTSENGAPLQIDRQKMHQIVGFS
jgi:predicted metal-dependent hydrolase